MLLTLAIGLGCSMLVGLIARYWIDVNSRDLGTMSRQWVVEQNAQPPSN